ncbi:transcriptional regulator, ArsR family [Paracoccus solventivorans]|uniref:Transcriptional regulator, ArsR family n=1 Tax=Paracoccus solventivorans TaxID=53463 RepID=A0A1M7JVV8_9RHOB|nr:metalloregulator ArsR/SmtB family transcription factor [Paracoccus solventivorans]SHM57156.1 transcriptional regulator, ArsR family [Paracoccus solventivorans]
MSSATELLTAPIAKVLAVAQQAKFFRGLADPSRLAILEALRSGTLSVSEIVAATGLSQPNASNHLRCLSECGLVAGEPRGRFVYYRLTDPRIDELLALVGELLEGTARSVDSCENYRAD